MVKAIVIDLDGTLYDSSGRKHYVSGKKKNYDKFHLASRFDKPNLWCAELIQSMKVVYLPIYVSGREDKYEGITLDWLKKYNLPLQPQAALFMRKTGDYRKDCVIKKEIYLEKIKPAYDVLFAIDDRQQVVDMWREQGLTCLQCGAGNF